MERYIRDQLSSCVIDKGVIHIPDSSDETIRAVGDQLRHDVLSMNVPHYKVIGVKVVAGSMGMSNYVIKSKDVDRSYAELLAVLHNVIYAEGGGYVNPNLMDSDFQNNIDNRGDLAFMVGVDEDIRSDNKTLYYVGEGTCPDSLVRDVPIIRSKSNSFSINLLLKRGTGNISFVEAEKVFKDIKNIAREYEQRHEVIEYVPISQYYDLTDILTVPMYMFGDKGIRLRYKKPVNESALQQIVRSYADTATIGEDEEGEE